MVIQTLSALCRIVQYLLLTLLLLQPQLSVADLPVQEPRNVNKGEKVFWLNTALVSSVLTWGYFNWDYGDKSAHFRSEHWFSSGTEHGGADKLGHLYTGYLITDGVATLYRQWGYDRKKASLYGAGTSLLMTGLVEVGDAFSSYGFSYEDMLANTAGAILGYYCYRYPDLRRKVDLRWEYRPEFHQLKSDFVTDYEHSKYLLALKGDGFNALQNSWLRAFELHLGYYTRNFDLDDPAVHASRKRIVYVGIGLNVPYLLKPVTRTRLFNYLQLPYSYVEINDRLD